MTSLCQFNVDEVRVSEFPRGPGRERRGPGKRELGRMRRRVRRKRTVLSDSCLGCLPADGRPLIKDIPFEKGRDVEYLLLFSLRGDLYKILLGVNIFFKWKGENSYWYWRSVQRKEIGHVL